KPVVALLARQILEPARSPFEKAPAKLAYGLVVLDELGGFWRKVAELIAEQHVVDEAALIQATRAHHLVQGAERAVHELGRAATTYDIHVVLDGRLPKPELRERGGQVKLGDVAAELTLRERAEDGGELPGAGRVVLRVEALEAHVEQGDHGGGGD